MKRIIMILLALAMVMSFVACNEGGEVTTEAPETTAAPETTKAPETQAPAQTEAPKAEGGCGGMISGAVALIQLGAGLAIFAAGA